MTQDVLGADPVEAIEHCYRMGWSDGLPVVPPTEARVGEFLDYVRRPSGQVVASMPPTGRSCSVLNAAVNAVMAGCLPQYFPVVLAALEALNEDRYNFYGSCASTGGSAQLIVVNGPIRDRLAMNSKGSFYGPGNRANNTIGRAIRLIILNVFGMTPGILDLSTQGQPGKYSLCFAENEEASPWVPLHVEMGYPRETSTVTVFAARHPQMAENHGSSAPEGILLTFADTMAGLGVIGSGYSVVVVSPEHAAIVGGAGWSKAQVKDFLYQHARRPVAELQRIGKASGPATGSYVHQGQSPEDILVVVAGGDAGGHSTFVPAWGAGSQWVTRPIALPEGRA